MSSRVERVEGIGLVQRRRYSADEKLRILEEAVVPGMTISFVARRHGISPSHLFHCRRRMAEDGKEAVRSDDAVASAAVVRAFQKRVRELERVLGRKTMENEILREPVQLGHEIELISRLPSLPGEDLP